MAVAYAVIMAPAHKALRDTPRDQERYARRQIEANMNDDSSTRVHRPWGWYDSVDRGECFQIRRIVVNPGGLLGTRIDDHCTGRWIVVQGTAKVTVGGRTVTLKDDESVLIPYGERHRVENVGPSHLEIIEVQVGSHIRGDDEIPF